MKLKKNFKKANVNFDSSMLNIGEMMESGDKHYSGHIILRIYDGFINLSDPKYMWHVETKLKGRKLAPGESVTLTQE